MDTLGCEDTADIGSRLFWKAETVGREKATAEATSSVDLR